MDNDAINRVVKTIREALATDKYKPLTTKDYSWYDREFLDAIQQNYDYGCLIGLEKANPKLLEDCTLQQLDLLLERFYDYEGEIV